MARHFKSVLMVIGGLCCIALSAVIGIFLFSFLTQGSELQTLGFFGLTPFSLALSIGLAQATGFAALAFLCFIIGVGLFAYGIAPPISPEQKSCRG
jgi:hypothetical protein